MVVPKRKYSEYTDKITIYIPKEIADLYRSAKMSGWDAPSLARSAVIDVFNKNKQLLLNEVYRDEAGTNTEIV